MGKTINIADFKKFLTINGITDLSENQMEKLAKDSFESADDLQFFKKFGRPRIRIKQTQFSSIEEIIEVGGLNDGYYLHVVENEFSRKKIFAPVTNTNEEELVLYWEGEGKVIPPGGADIYKYFKSKGFEVIEKAHPSLLINAIWVLTEAKLREIGIPSNVRIVLPIEEDSLLSIKDRGLNYVSVDRYDGKRRFEFNCCGVYWSGRSAFLLRKIKPLEV
ncbi:MAG: hypothetical protein NT068_03245 [Candidatus Nomurabacteria bacterium]|nr:hypothetical protein [Candidatus Nomurabacteria bacterium]